MSGRAGAALGAAPARFQLAIQLLNRVVFSLPFLTGVDVFIPAASPPNDTVEVNLTSRGKGKPRSLNFPNWRSSTERVSLIFNDHEQVAKK